MNLNLSGKLKTVSRISLAIASLILIGVFFAPAWRIDLFAPQYPEGLKLNIWIHKLSGDVDIINGLNHYIGMKPFSAKDFPELGYLSYIVIAFMILGLFIAWSGNKKLLLAYLVISVIGGTIAMVDFYNWEYAYGHNLNPEAPIQVPGLSYQPPLIGHKRLLNFDAYSYPDTGGWLVMISVGVAMGIFILEILKSKLKITTTLAVLIGTLMIVSCNNGPQAIRYGSDKCAHCQMTLIDQQFGGEIVTEKGKAFIFDDIGCMINYIKTRDLISKKGFLYYVVNFEEAGRLIPVEEAAFMKYDDKKSPMGSNLIAFGTSHGTYLGPDQKPLPIQHWEAIVNTYP